MKKGLIAGLILLSIGGVAEAQTTSTQAPAPAVQSGSPTRATGTGPGSAQGSATDTLDASDQKFFKKAAISGLSEVAAGQAATQQSSNQPVKDFAQQMVTDHGKINDDLMQLAQQKGVTLPTAPDAVHQKAMDSMMKLQGARFDKAYLKQQVKDHKDAVKLFKKASKSKDPEIQAFAQKTLPTLEHHLQMAEQLKKSS